MVLSQTKRSARVEMRSGRETQIGLYAAEVKRAAEDAERSAESARAAEAGAIAAVESERYLPIPGENGNWQIWDREHKKYVDSGETCLGEQGPQGPQGPQGERGFAPLVTAERTFGGVQITVTRKTDENAFEFSQTMVHDGNNGVTYVPTVKNGVLSWAPTPIPGDVVDPVSIIGPKGDKGDKGEKGERGDKGDPGDVSADERINGVLQATEISTIGPAAIATFDSSAADMPLKGLLVNIEPVQEGSGDPSPENVRPITGRTGCNVTRAGKNLLLQKYAGRTNNGINFVLVDDGSISITGKATNTAYYMSTSALNNPINATFLKAGTYTLSKTNYANIRYVANDISHGVTLGEAYNNDDLTFTLAQDALVAVNVRVDVSDLTYDGEVLYFKIESGSAATAYEPYQGATYPITFPTEAGTVYGGTLDVVNKKLTVEWIKISVDEAFPTGWAYAATVATPYFEHTISNVNITKRKLALCNQYKYAVPSGSSMLDLSFGFISNGGTIRFRNSNYTRIDDFVASLSGVEVIIPLATSTVYDLSDVPEITTLLGTNNIWADCGDVTVTYGAYIRQVKEYAKQYGESILSAIAPLEATYTASRAYAVGSYLFVGTKFYKVTQAIAEGETITPGTNVTLTTVAEQLVTLAAN